MMKEIIHIDDDELIRFSWKLKAKKLNIKIHSFPSYALFLESIEEFDKNIKIFIDSNLKGEGKGELFAKNLFEKYHFNTIYLSTGYEKSDFHTMPWIKSIIGKGFPEGQYLEVN